MLNQHKRGWMLGENGQMKLNSTLNCRSTSTKISIKIYKIFYAEVLNKGGLEYQTKILKCMLAALGRHLKEHDYEYSIIRDREFYQPKCSREK